MTVSTRDGQITMSDGWSANYPVANGGDTSNVLPNNDTPHKR